METGEYAQLETGMTELPIVTIGGQQPGMAYIQRGSERHVPLRDAKN